MHREPGDGQRTVGYLDWKTAALWAIAFACTVAALVVVAFDVLPVGSRSLSAKTGHASVRPSPQAFDPFACQWTGRELSPTRNAPAAASPQQALAAAIRARSIPGAPAHAYWTVLGGDPSEHGQFEYMIMLGGGPLDTTTNQQVFLHAEPGEGRSVAVVVRRHVQHSETTWQAAGSEAGTCTADH